MALPLPSPAYFVQGDLTALRRRRGGALRQGSFDVLVDETLLDGLACSAKGFVAIREALSRGQSIDER